MYCPIISYRKIETFPKKDCMGTNCAFYDEAAKGCLIRTYLITQIEKSNIVVKPVSSPVAELTPLEHRVEKLEKDVKYVGLGFPLDTYFGGGTK